jgi:hypothetical protein
MDGSTAVQVQEIVRRESSSLLAYIGDAFPWAAKAGSAALVRLRQIVAEHSRGVAILVRQLARRRVPPPKLGSYPSGFTAFNFLSLAHLLPQLIQSERQSLALLEAETPRVADAELRAAFEQFLTGKRDRLARLESLMSAPPASAPTPAAS